MRLLRTIAAGLQDVLAPARCIQCLCEGTWHCDNCRQQFRPYKLVCIVCGEESPRGLTCFECSDTTPLRGVVSAGSYHSTALRRGIHWLKFKRVRAVAPVLASLLVDRLLPIAPIDQLREVAVLVPIPLHVRRERQRGFNQSADIAQSLSDLTGIQVHNMLRRQRSTMTQSHLPRELRQENTSNAFTVIAKKAKQSQDFPSIVILIDDVTTSGSTLSAAAQVFPEDVTVWAATVARG